MFEPLKGSQKGMWGLFELIDTQVRKLCHRGAVAVKSGWERILLISAMTR